MHRRKKEGRERRKEGKEGRKGKKRGGDLQQGGMIRQGATGGEGSEKVQIREKESQNKAQ